MRIWLFLQKMRNIYIYIYIIIIIIIIIIKAWSVKLGSLMS